MIKEDRVTLLNFVFDTLNKLPISDRFIYCNKEQIDAFINNTSSTQLDNFITIYNVDNSISYLHRQLIPEVSTICNILTTSIDSELSKQKLTKYYSCFTYKYIEHTKVLIIRLNHNFNYKWGNL